MNIDMSICGLQLLDIGLPFIFNFHSGSNALSVYDQVSTCVKFLFTFFQFCFPSVQLLNVTLKTLKLFR